MKPKSTNGTRIGIVNPLTLVGNEVKTILTERRFPFWRLDLIDSEGDEEGTLTEIQDEAAVVVPASEETFEDLDLVFFCGKREANQRWIERHTEDGFVAIDLSRASGADGVHVIAGVNDDAISDDHPLVISPHPVAVSIGLIIHALRARFDVTRCIASVVQPASEMGKAGVDELFQQTVKTLNMQPIPREVFDRQLAFNLYPAPFAPEQERHVRSELRSILGADLEIALSLTQGTLFHGHSLSLFVETPTDHDEQEVRAALAANPAFDTADEDSNSTVDAAGRDEILIGRVSVEEDVPIGFWIWAVVDNLRRARALNAVMIAETIISRFGETVH